MDTLFQRQLFNGVTYDPLISASSSTSTDLESGDTHTSIKLMREWTEKHYKQVEKLASRLEKKTLGNTVKTIKNWLYGAIQYKKDGTEQLLRSPARSWADRESGVDCKSYSIFASSILLNLKIIHYFRMIKQINLRPDDFSHVYVIVPKDQVSGSLDKGYYTIDGTIRSDKEPLFTENFDLIMKHKGLNGVAFYDTGLNCSCQSGLNTFDWNNFANTTGNLLNTSVSSYFGTQNAKYNARANEIKAQSDLEAEKAKAAAAAIEQQTKLLEMQLQKSQNDNETNIARQKLENERQKLADDKKSKTNLVIGGVVAVTVLAIGIGVVVIQSKKKKKAA